MDHYCHLGYDFLHCIEVKLDVFNTDVSGPRVPQFSIFKSESLHEIFKPYYSALITNFIK